MARNDWHILREGGALTMARRLPVRFDLFAETVMPAARKERIARQVRQDLWRLLRDVRGFAPVVRVEQEGASLRVTAGGQVDGRIPGDAVERVAGMLMCPGHRERWLRWAR